MVPLKCDPELHNKANFPDQPNAKCCRRTINALFVSTQNYIRVPITVTYQWRIQDFSKEGAPTPGGVAPTYDFAKFSEKLHEIERIGTPGGGRPPRPP